MKLCGFVRVRGWECLYIHNAKGLVLSIYVGDFKMGGRKENIAPMWDQLRHHLDLDPPVPSHNNVYLGMRQTPCVIPKHLVEKKRQFYNQIMKLNDPTEETLACKAQTYSKAKNLVRVAQPTKKSRADGNVKHEENAKADKGEIKGYQNDLTGNATSSVELYLEMAGLKQAIRSEEVPHAMRRRLSTCTRRL